MKESSIKEVLQRYTPQLMSISGVVGTGIGKRDGKPCIKVLVIQKTPEIIQKIPSTLEDFKVVIETRGVIRAQKKIKNK
jgi:hypothetical protein